MLVYRFICSELFLDFFLNFFLIHLLAYFILFVLPRSHFFFYTYDYLLPLVIILLSASFSLRGMARIDPLLFCSFASPFFLSFVHDWAGQMEGDGHWTWSFFFFLGLILIAARFLHYSEISGTSLRPLAPPWEGPAPALLYRLAKLDEASGSTMTGGDTCLACSIILRHYVGGERGLC